MVEEPVKRGLGLLFFHPGHREFPKNLWMRNYLIDLIDNQVKKTPFFSTLSAISSTKDGFYPYDGFTPLPLLSLLYY
jgi:hypothetical protein